MKPLLNVNYNNTLLLILYICFSTLVRVFVQLISMDVSSSGGLGVCSSEDGRLWVWDADTGETRVRICTRYIYAIIFVRLIEHDFERIFNFCPNSIAFFRGTCRRCVHLSILPIRHRGTKWSG